MPLKPPYSFFFMSLETMTKVAVAFLIRFGKIYFSGGRPFLPLLWAFLSPFLLFPSVPDPDPALDPDPDPSIIKQM
jgi:hypothetical protein